MVITEAVQDKTPLDNLIEKESLDISRDDRERFTTFLVETLWFILNQNTERKDVVIYSILYALNDYLVNENSAREQAKILGISYGLIPHYVKQYKQKMGL